MELFKNRVSIDDFGNFLVYIFQCFDSLYLQSAKNSNLDIDYLLHVPCWLVTHTILSAWIGDQDIHSHCISSSMNESKNPIIDIYLELKKGNILEISYKSPGCHWFVIFPLSNGKVCLFDNKASKNEKFRIKIFPSIYKFCFEFREMLLGKRKDFFFDQYCDPKKNSIIYITYPNKNGIDWNKIHKEMTSFKKSDIESDFIWDIETISWNNNDKLPESDADVICDIKILFDENDK